MYIEGGRQELLQHLIVHNTRWPSLLQSRQGPNVFLFCLVLWLAKCISCCNSCFILTVDVLTYFFLLSVGTHAAVTLSVLKSHHLGGTRWAEEKEYCNVPVAFWRSGILEDWVNAETGESFREVSSASLCHHTVEANVLQIT